MGGFCIFLEKQNGRMAEWLKIELPSLIRWWEETQKNLAKGRGELSDKHKGRGKS